MPEETKPAGSSTATTEAEKATIEPDLEESDTDDDDSEEAPKGDLHKSKRWAKVYGDLKSYKGLNKTPAELQAAMKRLEQYDEIVEEENRKVAARRKDDDEEPDEETTKRRKMARKELSKIAPEVDKIEKAAEQVAIFFTSLERSAIREMTKLLKDAGMSTKEKSLEAMSDVLSATISEDEELYDEYIRNPKAAVQEAFKRFRSDSVDAASRAAKANLQKDKTKLMGLPKTHKAGGAPEVSPNRTEGPKNLVEARKAAERRLAALEE